MKINILNKCRDFNTYRAARVKSLFNPERGNTFELTDTLDIDDGNWQIGLIVGQSGTGKTSMGRVIFGEDKICDLYGGWDSEKPIIDCIDPTGDFNTVTGSLAAVGLGDVPAWLRPFSALSNGQRFRAGLARLICEQPTEVVVDEFTSVVDRQIAKVGALAFSKAWKRLKGKKAVLLSCHYDITDWLQPDWVYDTTERRFERGLLRERPKIELQIWKTNSSYWKMFKQHYYLDLPMPVAASYFVGTVQGEPVCHVAVCPKFESRGYRATRLVVMPEWQGAGVGTRFLESVCQWHKAGNGLGSKKFGTFFHTSHPQLIQYMRRSANWILKSQVLYGGDKRKSGQSIIRTTSAKEKITSGGYGGHFRAVQGFKYIGVAA